MTLHLDSPAQQAVARTGFYASIVSYAVFWACDAIRAGFVSDYFSVHWFLLAAIVFASWWGALHEEPVPVSS